MARARLRGTSWGKANLGDERGGGIISRSCKIPNRTPVLQCNISWGSLSHHARLALLDFYHRLKCIEIDKDKTVYTGGIAHEQFVSRWTEDYRTYIKH